MNKLSRVLYDFYLREGLKGFGSHFSETSGLFLKNILSSDYNFLDAGCGKGFYVNFASKHVKHAVGIDISLPLLREAQSSFRAFNTDFIQASWDALPFREESFDVVIWFDGPEHAIDPKLTLLEIRKVLRRFLLVSAPVSTCILILPEYFEVKLNKTLAITSGKPFRGHINAYTRRTLMKLLTSSGLVILHERSGVPHIPLFKQICLLLCGLFREKRMYWSISLCTAAR